MKSAQTVDREIKIIGHRHPDTDSVCAAYSYSVLKNALGGGQVYTPYRAGELNRETEFVLNYFKVTPPKILMDVSPQVRDLEVRMAGGIAGSTSLRRAWKRMREETIDTLCVTDGNNRLKGVITVKDVATANMDSFDTEMLAKANTPYENVLETLEGTLVVGDVKNKTVTGRLVIGSGNAEAMERAISKGDIVIVMNRIDSQLAAIEMEAGCVVVCASAKIPSTIQTLAAERGTVIISTEFSTYVAGRLISQAAPVEAYMRRENLLTFTLDTTVEEVTRVMAEVRHRYFPILKNGRYYGVLSRRNLLNQSKKRVIMVDHNEKEQAVEGIDRAEVLEIIDHHRIATMPTEAPLYFRNVPVGCTCTIVYGMYRENGVEIPKQAAGLMLSAILSDTLMFRSPTCTPADEAAARDLAKIAGVELEAYADAMFEAGGDIAGRGAEEVFGGDYKTFSSGDIEFGVGQGSYMSQKNRQAAETLVGPYLETARKEQGLDNVFYLFTDVRSSSSDILMAGKDAEQIVAEAFGVEVKDGKAALPGVVSRKKQVIPVLLRTYKAYQEKKNR